jgi:hypothetical protein
MINGKQAGCWLLAAILMISLMPTIVSARGANQLSARVWLSQGEAGQAIHVGRLMKRHQELVEECAPAMDPNEFRGYLSDWLTNHPQFLSRSVHLAFTTALTDLCRNPVPN